ncbi:alanine racemase [Mailhella sp.]|uniref:alanine racemase n=1 Tax=Mailhella sp. TaxID=1981029 RepID=UPI003AB83ACC
MPRLIVSIDALRHNLALLQERCRRVGAECMFVFKEAPLHAALVADVMKKSTVRRLGLVAWPHAELPSIPGVELHHVYAPSPLLASKVAACDCAYVNARFTLQALALACGEKKPELRLCLEVGDDRDGILPEELPELCAITRNLGFSLRGLEINFACLSTEAPTTEKLLFADSVLRKVRKFCLPTADISAGGTDVLELTERESLPSTVREIRCGTGVTLGRYPLSGRIIPDARQDAFRLEAQILECRVKKTRRLALFDVGTFHTAPEKLLSPLPGMRFAGASSAYASFDVTDCPETLREGMTLSFSLDYHALSRALSSQALPVVREDA